MSCQFPVKKSWLRVLRKRKNDIKSKVKASLSRKKTKPQVLPFMAWWQLIHYQKISRKSHYIWWKSKDDTGTGDSSIWRMRGHRRTRRVTWEVGMVVDWHEKQHWLMIIWLWLDPLLWNPGEHFRFVNTTPVCEASSWQRVDRIFRTGRGDFKSKMMINIQTRKQPKK